MATGSSCKIQIMSDLHLETHPTYDYDFPKTAPYLALLGDIGHVATEHLMQFLVRQLLRYRILLPTWQPRALPHQLGVCEGEDKQIRPKRRTPERERCVHWRVRIP